MKSPGGGGVHIRNIGHVHVTFQFDVQTKDLFNLIFMFVLREMPVYNRIDTKRCMTGRIFLHAPRQIFHLYHSKKYVTPDKYCFILPSHSTI